MPIIKKIFPVALGAIIGLSYWYFIGCTTGSCPLTSKWWTATLYGALAGATFLLPSKQAPGKNPTPDNTNS